jgi:LysM repeat protein
MWHRNSLSKKENGTQISQIFADKRAKIFVLLLFWSLMLVARPVLAQQTPVPSPTPGEDGRVIYIVAAGDTLTLIALRFGVTLEQLYELNNLTAESLITIGQPIVLAIGAAGIGGTPVSDFPGAVIQPDGMVVHRVKAGDTLISIALTYGLTLEELYEVSGLNENSVLRVGQDVVIGHLPTPESSGGSADVPGGTHTPTPTITLTPSPTTPPPTTTPIVLAVAVAPTPLPTIAMPVVTPLPVVDVPSLPDSNAIVAAFVGLVVLLALAGGIFLYLGRQR